MRLVVYCLATALAAEAGVVQGIVVEHASGLPMARTRVRLQAIPKPGGDVLASEQRADRAGQFTFRNVPEGLYLLFAMRAGYFPAAYGQRRPSGQGMPFQVTRDSEFFSQLRMRREGAITGRVLDENGVGIEGAPVLAYRAKLPLRSAGRAVSDDRGVYRIHGLAAGRYWIRAAAYTLDDGSGLLPTFGPESRELRDARVHEVALDADTAYADVRPEPGTLFRLRGLIQCSDPAPGPATVTLSSETMRRTTQAGCNEHYVFEGLAPASYEVLATRPTESGFIELFLDRNSDLGTVALGPQQQVIFEVGSAGSPGLSNIPVVLTGRRRDLFDADSDHQIEMRATLAPGHWEISARAGEGQYIESIVNTRALARRSSKPEQPTEWFDVFFPTQLQSRIRITVSDKAGQIAGSVASEGKGVPGAPVYLWPVAETARRSLRGWLQALSDLEGKFRFDGLPPGDYRLLATFDISEVDQEALDEARATTVRVEPSQKSGVELPIWIAPN